MPALRRRLRASPATTTPKKKGKLSTCTLSPDAVGEALRRVFVELDELYKATVRDTFALGFGSVARVGSCGLAVVLQPAADSDAPGGGGVSIVCGNAGDSRAVLGRFLPPEEEEEAAEAAKGDAAAAAAANGGESEDGETASQRVEAMPLSRDHNMREAAEQDRLSKLFPKEAAARELFQCVRRQGGPCYLKGRLQPTRAFGDLFLKDAAFNGPDPSAKRHRNGDGSRGPHIPGPHYHPPYVTAEPEISAVVLPPRRRVKNLEDLEDLEDLEENRSFLILATDGLWDHISNEEAVRLVASDEMERSARERRRRQRRRRWGGDGAGGGDAAVGGVGIGGLLWLPSWARQLFSGGGRGGGSEGAAPPGGKEPDGAPGGAATAGSGSGDDDARPCAAQLLCNAALSRAAADRGVATSQLKALPPGASRRQHHDDISVLVLFLK